MNDDQHRKELAAAQLRIDAAKQRIDTDSARRAVVAEVKRQGGINVDIISNMIRAETRHNPETNCEYCVALHADGQATSVAGAVARLKTDAEYQHLFQPATPTAKPAKQAIDVSKLSMTEYLELRKTSPDTLGLSSRYTQRRRR